MTLTLLLIRHAKAGTGEVDHARPLDGRGRDQAPRMGAWIAARGLVPKLALCSDAHRTRETLDLMLPLWAPPPRLSHLRPLYHASPEAILAVLVEAAEGPAVAVVGHNPGIGELAARLAARTPDHPRWGDFPTCFVAALRFEAEGWGDVRDGTGEVVAFAVPGDLA
jgi:phosphohistidine phosphatase